MKMLKLCFLAVVIFKDSINVCNFGEHWKVVINAKCITTVVEDISINNAFFPSESNYNTKRTKQTLINKELYINGIEMAYFK